MPISADISALVIDIGQPIMADLVTTYDISCNCTSYINGLIHPKIKILSVTHPHVVQTPYDFSSSSEHKLRYF